MPSASVSTAYQKLLPYQQHIKSCCHLSSIEVFHIKNCCHWLPKVIFFALWTQSWSVIYLHKLRIFFTKRKSWSAWTCFCKTTKTHLLMNSRRLEMGNVLDLRLIQDLKNRGIWLVLDDIKIWRLHKGNLVGLRWILAVAEYILSPGGIHPRTCHKIYKLPQNQLEIYKLPGYSFSQEGTISMGLQKKTISIENMIFHMIWWNTASCGGPLFS